MESEEKPAASKKRKLSGQEESWDHTYNILTNFSGFKVEKILLENSKTKCLFVQGKFAGNEEKAVVLLEKTAFLRDHAQKYLSAETALNNTLKNDIYGTYQAFPSHEENAVKATVIYPATEKHIAKYTEQEGFIVRETTQLYITVTLPHLLEGANSIQWVYNILEKKTESDRIVFEDCDPENGFILLPDMKWNRKDVDSLYLVAIVHRHGIRSLRDLNQSHLPLLKNILHAGQAAIQEKFGVSVCKLRVYVHYQPSYYHFHVHFNHLNFDTPGFEASRAHLLTDVIENIELMDDFYMKKTLEFVVREKDALYTKLKDSGHFDENRVLPLLC